jgi:hypothetical protein
MMKVEKAKNSPAIMPLPSAARNVRTVSQFGIAAPQPMRRVRAPDLIHIMAELEAAVQESASVRHALGPIRAPAGFP